MKYRTLSLLLLFTSLFFFTYAQENPDVKFNEMTHDFGTIKQGDPAEFVFKFTNTSKEILQLTQVKASCGCTTPSWTRDSVKPGAEGEISVKYNTNRVGPFTKSVTVTYHPDKKPVVLYIRGKVEPTEPAVPAISYKEVVGGLAFDKLSTNIGTMDSDKEIKQVFQVKNISPIKIDFTDRFEVGPMFRVDIDRTSLTPGQTATITVSVLGRAFKEGGTFDEQIKLYTTEQEDAAKVLRITGNIHKVLSAEEKAALPNIEFATTSYEGGKVLEGEKVSYAFPFTNTGKQDLIIESVKASCGCTATAPKDKVIKPGQASEIVATFDSRGRRGRQSKSITVKTNDPDNPTTVLRFAVEVESDPFHANDLGPAAKPGTGINHE
ncbi:MAG: DUF1573 domain-containing protein [Bacteroidetes bacterium]|nr:MAG: DUF1573 domain-containing protein [Bacteroidota bacterium]